MAGSSCATKTADFTAAETGYHALIYATTEQTVHTFSHRSQLVTLGLGTPETLANGSGQLPKTNDRQMNFRELSSSVRQEYCRNNHHENDQ